jgi:Ca2+-binding RTX toxin-like protein
MANYLKAAQDILTLMDSEEDSHSGLQLLYGQSIVLISDLTLAGKPASISTTDLETYNVIFNSSANFQPNANFNPLSGNGFVFNPTINFGPADVVDQLASTANNLIIGDKSTNILLGGNGDDIIIGGSGPATMFGGLGGSNLLIGGTGTDYMSGGFGSGGSTLVAGTGTDYMAGMLVSASSIQTSGVQGTIGNTLVGGSGYDLMAGAFITATATFVDTDVTVTGYYAGSTLIGGSGTTIMSGVFESVSYSQGTLTNYFETSYISPNTLIAGTGNESLYGAAHTLFTNGTFNHMAFHEDGFYEGNTLIGGSGQNLLVGDFGSHVQFWDTITGYIHDNAGNNHLTGGSGPTIMIGEFQTLSDNVLHSPNFDLVENLGNYNVGNPGGNGNNILTAGSGTTLMIGDVQNLNVTLDSVSHVTVNFGNNTLIAGTGNDTMYGAVQNLNVSPNTILNFGQDTFQFNLGQQLGKDVIGDMNVGHNNNPLLPEDILSFTGVSTIAAVDNMFKFGADSSGHLIMTQKVGSGSIDFANIVYAGQHSVLDVTPHVLVHP